MTGEPTEAEPPRVGVSPITGNVYRVDEYEERKPGRLIAESKTELESGDVPSDVVHALAREALDR